MLPDIKHFDDIAWNRLRTLEKNSLKDGKSCKEMTVISTYKTNGIKLS